MRRLTRVCALGSALALALVPRTRAFAQEQDGACARPRGVPSGPVQASLLDGDLGRGYRACARSDVALGGDGLLVIEPDEFYGRLQAAGVLRAGWAPSADSELHLRLELLRYDTVISSVDAATLGLGHTTLGATQRLFEGARTRVSLGARLVLPTAFALYRHAWPLAADVLGLLEHRAHDALRLHASAGLIGSLALGSGPEQPRLGFATSAGAQWLPWRWGSLVLDVYGQLGYAALLDVLALSPALRFGGDQLGVELSAVVPVLGRERALLAGFLQVSWRW